MLFQETQIKELEDGLTVLTARLKNVQSQLKDLREGV